MILTDFKCNDCGHIFPVGKDKALDDFPVDVECPECKSHNTKRVWSFAAFDISLGRYGNASTGYSREITRKWSSYGKFKGKRIR